MLWAAPAQGHPLLASQTVKFQVYILLFVLVMPVSLVTAMDIGVLRVSRFQFCFPVQSGVSGPFPTFG